MNRFAFVALMVLAGCTAKVDDAPRSDTATAPSATAGSTPPAAEKPTTTFAGSDLERGAELPVSKFKTLEGETYDVSSLRGKAVLVNIWATWCVPCREEMPDLARLAESMKGKPFELVGVSVDDAENHEKVKAFVTEIDVQYPIVVDPESELLTALNTPVLPTTVLLDRNGKAQWLKMGPIRHDDPKLLEALQSAMQ